MASKSPDEDIPELDIELEAEPDIEPPPTINVPKFWGSCNIVFPDNLGIPDEVFVEKAKELMDFFQSLGLHVSRSGKTVIVSKTMHVQKKEIENFILQLRELKRYIQDIVFRFS